MIADDAKKVDAMKGSHSQWIYKACAMYIEDICGLIVIAVNNMIREMIFVSEAD